MEAGKTQSEQLHNFCLNLSNCYAELPDDASAHPKDAAGVLLLDREAGECNTGACSANQVPKSPATPPDGQHVSVLVVGTSLARPVAIRGGRTFCYPGACVKEITSSALLLVDQHDSASAVVIEAGVNDCKFQQSELLRKEFVDSLLDTGKQCFISGQLLATRFGDVNFSCLCQLHIWLKGFCRRRGFPLVDNFTSF